VLISFYKRSLSFGEGAELSLQNQRIVFRENKERRRRSGHPKEREKMSGEKIRFGYETILRGFLRPGRDLYIFDKEGGCKSEMEMLSDGYV